MQRGRTWQVGTICSFPLREKCRIRGQQKDFPLDSVAPALSAPAPCIALPPISLRASRVEEAERYRSNRRWSPRYSRVQYRGVLKNATGLSTHPDRPSGA
jgi:hypothetical protein